MDDNGVGDSFVTYLKDYQYKIFVSMQFTQQYLHCYEWPIK